MAPVPTSSVVRKSPVAKNRVLVTSAPVELPPPEPETRPSMARLTLVLGACFALGVAWPLAGGLEFVQRPPGSGATKAPDTEGSGGDGEPGPGASPEVPALHAAPLATGAVPELQNRVLQSCENEAGEALARCDAPDLEHTLDEPLAKLGACGRALGASGVLSLGMYLDFSRGRVDAVKAGQSTTLSKEQTAKLLGCAEESIVGTALDGVEHEQARYWVYYVVRLQPAGGADLPGPEEIVSASGQATVGWQEAVVREGPSSQARVATRLAHGTRISVTGRAGDWYRIARSGKVIGWVHREALGL